MSNNQAKHDDVRWLAMLIRQGLKLIVAGIEKRYGLDAKPEANASRAADRRAWP